MIMMITMGMAAWLEKCREDSKVKKKYSKTVRKWMCLMCMTYSSCCSDAARPHPCWEPYTIWWWCRMMMMISWCLPPRRAECLPPQRSEMRWSRRSRWCQDVYHSIYLGVYHRRMKNMMMLVMMMMMVSWIHLTRSSFYVITTCFPRGAAASRVEDLDR